jgi:hypothetical protein
MMAHSTGAPVSRVSESDHVIIWRDWSRNIAICASRNVLKGAEDVQRPAFRLTDPAPPLNPSEHHHRVRAHGGSPRGGGG